MFNFSNCRLALLVALLLPSLSLAQGPPLPDQTTVDNTQQVTVYDSTLPVRERNLRITVGLLRSGLPATIESGECVQGNSAGTALVFATCASGRGTFLDLTAVGGYRNSHLHGQHHQHIHRYRPGRQVRQVPRARRAPPARQARTPR